MKPFQSGSIPRMLTLAMAILSGVGWSQTPQAGSDGNKPGKKLVRFVCTEIAPDTPETLKLLGKSGVCDVPLSTRTPGELFEIPKTGEIRLGIDSGNPEAPITPLTLGTVPDGTSRATALLINRPAKPDGTKYDLLLINDSKLKGGSVYFLNTTTRGAAVKLDGKQLMLPQGKPVIFQPEDLATARNSTIAVMVETYDDGNSAWRPLMSSTWRLRKTRIEICILYWNEKYRRPSIKGLTLFPMPEISP